jgi:hypothetical protein
MGCGEHGFHRTSFQGIFASKVCHQRPAEPASSLYPKETHRPNPQVQRHAPFLKSSSLSLFVRKMSTFWNSTQLVSLHWWFVLFSAEHYLSNRPTNVLNKWARCLSYNFKCNVPNTQTWWTTQVIQNPLWHPEDNGVTKSIERALKELFPYFCFSPNVHFMVFIFSWRFLFLSRFSWWFFLLKWCLYIITTFTTFKWAAQWHEIYSVLGSYHQHPPPGMLTWPEAAVSYTLSPSPALCSHHSTFCLYEFHYSDTTSQIWMGAYCMGSSVTTLFYGKKF